MSVQLVIETAQRIISGDVGVVEGSRILASLSNEVSKKDTDPDFIPFIGIDSESDHIPLGDVRKRWSVASLAKMDSELIKIEERHRKLAIEASVKLVKRYADLST